MQRRGKGLNHPEKSRKETSLIDFIDGAEQFPVTTWKRRRNRVRKYYKSVQIYIILKYPEPTQKC